jgi:hypothetical protein
MPILSLPIAADGPVVLLAVSPSASRIKALNASKIPVPEPVVIRGLVDTGASCSAVDPTVIKRLGIEATGNVSILTASTGETPHACEQYDVALMLVMPPQDVHVLSVTIPVLQAHLNPQGIQALLGRDVLSKGILVYNSHSGSFSLAY